MIPAKRILWLLACVLVGVAEPELVGHQAGQRGAEAGGQAAVVLAVEEVGVEAEEGAREDRVAKDRVEQLGLDLMSRANGTRHETAFTTSPKSAGEVLKSSAGIWVMYSMIRSRMSCVA